MKKKILLFMASCVLLLAPYIALADIVTPPDLSPRWDSEKQEAPKTMILVVSGAVVIISGVVTIVAFRKLRSMKKPDQINNPTNQNKPNDTNK